MPISDKDLAKMVKNLKRAFDAASSIYEANVDYDGASSTSSRQTASDLAVISQAYLAATQEQDRRAEEAEKYLPGKSLKSPSAPKQ